MKCVILAAGRGERMMPLTADTPKPLLKVNGKPIIDYIFEVLPEEIDEVVVVVKYLGDKIKRHLRKRKGVKITFVTGSSKGNAQSFLKAAHLLDERFLLIYGDEIPMRTNVVNCLKEDLSVLTYDEGVYDGVMVLNADIVNYHHSGGQFVNMVKNFVKDHRVTLVQAEDFVGKINTPNDLFVAEQMLNG